ncbi:MAG TPA: hypothetical protein VH867_01110 [Burkholderiales bacterium]|jgi:hypothetical protein
MEAPVDPETVHRYTLEFEIQAVNSAPRSRASTATVTAPAARPGGARSPGA